ncbi:hypothetical protein ACFQ7O_23925 [Streptomyces sp. NPDC056485]|uniref:hypothetical protein n=1 Tax=Streptomyces sp. NPDC056485 TaxID=3345834 RepID=UPI0036C90052
MKREQLLAHTRAILWQAWTTSGEDLASEAAATLINLGMLVPEGGAAELDRLRMLTNAQPADLSEAQLGALIDAGNRELADFYHERACACSEWPTSCSTNPSMARGYWDTDAFAIGMSAVIGLWESMRTSTSSHTVAPHTNALHLETQ